MDTCARQKQNGLLGEGAKYAELGSHKKESRGRRKTFCTKLYI